MFINEGGSPQGLRRDRTCATSGQHKTHRRARPCIGHLRGPTRSRIDSRDLHTPRRDFLEITLSRRNGSPVLNFADDTHRCPWSISDAGHVVLDLVAKVESFRISRQRASVVAKIVALFSKRRSAPDPGRDCDEQHEKPQRERNSASAAGSVFSRPIRTRLSSCGWLTSYPRSKPSARPRAHG